MRFYLPPLPYMQQVLQFAQSQTHIWHHFASALLADNTVAITDDLDKHAYLVSASNYPLLFEALAWVQNKMDLSDVVFEVYQYPADAYDGAGIIIANKQARLILSGRAWQNMDLSALQALLAHECAHYYLLQADKQAYAVCLRVLQALATEHYHSAVYQETCRKFQLFTEIYCDRVAYTLLQSYEPLLQVLIDMSAGLEKAAIPAYIAQAKGVLEKDSHFTSQAASHPENFIRALSLWYWHNNQHTADMLINDLLTPQQRLDKMDCFQQKALQHATCQLWQAIVQPAVMQDEYILAHAASFFPAKAFEAANTPIQLPLITNNSHESIHYYYAYLLMDVLVLPHDLEDLPLAWTSQLAQKIGVMPVFEKLLASEWKCSLTKIKERIAKANIVFSQQLSA